MKNITIKDIMKNIWKKIENLEMTEKIIDKMIIGKMTIKKMIEEKMSLITKKKEYNTNKNNQRSIVKVSIPLFSKA